VDCCRLQSVTATAPGCTELSTWSGHPTRAASVYCSGAAAVCVGWTLPPPSWPWLPDGAAYSGPALQGVVAGPPLCSVSWHFRLFSSVSCAACRAPGHAPNLRRIACLAMILRPGLEQHQRTGLWRAGIMRYRDVVQPAPRAPGDVRSGSALARGGDPAPAGRQPCLHGRRPGSRHWVPPRSPPGYRQWIDAWGQMALGCLRGSIHCRPEAGSCSAGPHRTPVTGPPRPASRLLEEVLEATRRQAALGGSGRGWAHCISRLGGHHARGRDCRSFAGGRTKIYTAVRLDCLNIAGSAR